MANKTRNRGKKILTFNISGRIFFLFGNLLFLRCSDKAMSFWRWKIVITNMVILLSNQNSINVFMTYGYYFINHSHFAKNERLKCESYLHPYFTSHIFNLFKESFIKDNRTFLLSYRIFHKRNRIIFRINVKTFYWHLFLLVCIYFRKPLPSAILMIIHL